MKKQILSLIPLLAFASAAYSAIAIDTAFDADGIFTASGDDTISATTSLSVGTGSDRYLLAFISARAESDPNLAAGLPSVTTLSYGGNNFSAVSGSLASIDDGYVVSTQAYALAIGSGVTGANDLVYNISTSSSNNPRGMTLTFLALEDVGSVSSLDTTAAQSSSAVNTSGSVAAGSWIVGSAAWVNSARTATAETGQTTFGDISGTIGDTFNIRSIAGYESITSAGTESMNWTLSGNSDSAGTLLEVTDVPEPSTFALMGGALALCVVMLRRRRS